MLLAHKREDILENCNNVDLVIQLSKFNYPACNTKIIKYADLEAYGTHSVWLTDSGIKLVKCVLIVLGISQKLVFKVSFIYNYLIRM